MSRRKFIKQIGGTVAAGVCVVGTILGIGGGEYPLENGDRVAQELSWIGH